MIVQEAHVQLDLRLQRLNSNAFDIFYKEEKDLILDYAQNVFIRESLPYNEGNRKNEGFQSTTKRYDDLQTLITKRVIPLYIKEANVQYNVLPYDYRDFITGNPNLQASCNNISRVFEIQNIYIAYLPFADSILTGGVYANFKWVLGYSDATPDLILADRSAYTNFPTINFNDEKFVISRFGIYETNRQNSPVKVYWEKYGEIYAPNTFIFISTASNLSKVTMTIETGTTKVATFSNLTRNSYTAKATPVKTNSRLIETQFIQSFLANPYQTTKPDSVVVELCDNQILLHHDSTFFADSIELIYIRKPKPVCSFLGVSFEVHESRHDKIVDMAANIAAAFIGNPREVQTLSNFINKQNE